MGEMGDSEDKSAQELETLWNKVPDSKNFDLRCLREIIKRGYKPTTIARLPLKELSVRAALWNVKEGALEEIYQGVSDHDRHVTENKDHLDRGPVVNFVKILLRGSYNYASSSLDLATQPPGLSSKRIYIRKCYYVLRDQIFHSWQLRRRVLVLGSPGIGKTYFVFYLLHYYVNLGHTVVYVRSFGGSHYSCVVTEDDVKCSTNTSEQWLELSDPETIYLCDGKEPQIDGIAAKICLCISPDEESFEIYRYKCNPVTFIMPSCNLSEMVQIWKSCYTESISTRKEIEGRFNLWGESIRHVLELESDAKKLQTYIVKRSPGLDNMLRTINRGMETDKKITHTLIHYKVEEPEYSTLPPQRISPQKCKKVSTLNKLPKLELNHSSSSDSSSDSSSSSPPPTPTPTYFTNFTLDFASRHIADLITDEFEEGMTHRFYNTVLFGEGASNYYETLQGRLFESLFHKYISKGGSFSVRDSMGVKTTLQIPPMLTLQSHALSDVLSVSSTGLSVIYWRPLSAIQETIDSVIPSLHFLFQVTKSSEHKLNLEVIEKIKQEFGWNEAQLFFVVPPYRFSDFKIHQEHKGVKQFVFEFSLDKRGVKRKLVEKTLVCGYEGCESSVECNRRRCTLHKGLREKKRKRKKRK